MKKTLHFLEFLITLTQKIVSKVSLKLIVPIVLVVFGYSIYTILLYTQEYPKTNPPSEQMWSVRAVSVTPQTERPRLKIFGQLTILTPIEIRTGVAGFVARRHEDFVRGSIVKKGQVLVQLEQHDLQLVLQDMQFHLQEAQILYDEISASLARERQLLEVDTILLQLSQNRLTRHQDLQNRGVTATEVLESTKMETERMRRVVTDGEAYLKVLQAQQQRQRVVIDRLRTSVEKAQRDLEYTTITAPETSFVQDILINQGSRVSVNQVVGVLLPLSDLGVEFRLSIDEYARLTRDVSPLIGRRVDMTWGHDPPQTLTGHITRVDARIQENNGGILVYALLSEEMLNPNTPLRPGLFLEITLEDALFDQVIRLPASAIMPDGHIYMVTPDKRLVSKKAQIVLRTGSMVLVQVKDITQEMCIVVTQFNQIGDGIKVDYQGCDRFTSSVSSKTGIVRLKANPESG